MSRYITVLMTACTCLATACGGGGSAVAAVPGALPVSAVRQDPPEAEAHAAVDGLNGFAVDLLQQLRSTGQDNVVVSPYSISTALGMVYAGARGSTASQMEDVLGYPSPPEQAHASLNALGLAIEDRARSTGLELNTANQVWVKPGLSVQPAFMETLARFYGAPLAELDFGAGGEEVVNGWVAERTNDRIPELFPPGSFDASTAMVLANALYLDAAWQRPFQRSATVAREFTRLDGSVVTVPMMHNDRELPSASGDGWDAVELAYTGNELSMVVIVPHNLESFEQTLSASLLDEVFANMTDGGIHFAMPRTSFSYQAALPTTLKRMGIRDAFNAPDFSGLTGDRSLSLNQVEHEVFIAIDEEGTEAAAATGAEMVESHGPAIEATTPYMIVIRDRPTGAILFIGSVTDPSVKAQK